ncbi:uncharacterized protein CCOS01_10648 [Colletotrichum costaricense]|uniref:CCHC-type domain-containing protein n=1 Tax=Colletotrichum costaricense TaxID=1209916 RepID=A0AAI9YRL6_9PEZI|nr:uncharacterized protein CCOS01_10648 [Colletotrichum costaricense]KAK1520529.1 hypothetical protein CCOS01_10648 [Colletotrichum costaricense]
MSDHHHAPWLPEPNVPPAPRGNSMTFGYLGVSDKDSSYSIVNPQRGQDIVVDDRGSSIRFTAPAQRAYEPLGYIMGQAAARGRKIGGVIWFEDETLAEHPMPVFDPPATIANERHTASTNSISYGTTPPTNPGPVRQAVQQQDAPSPPTQQATPDFPPRQQDPPSLPEPQADLGSPPGQTVQQEDWPSLPPRPSTAESSSRQTQKKPAPPQLPAPTPKPRVGKPKFVSFPGLFGGAVHEESVDASGGSDAGTHVSQLQSPPRTCGETSAATTASEKQAWQTVEKKKGPSVMPHPFSDKELLRHNRSRKCANCAKKGHIALDCVLPASRGCINLCVWCNKSDHSFDDCKNPSKPTDKERLFHILVVRRANKCPVETSQSWWDLCSEASRINDPSSNAKDMGNQFRSLCESNVGFPWRAVLADCTFLIEIDEYDYVEDTKRRASTLPVVDAYTHDSDLLLTRHALAYERVGGVQAYAAFAKTRDNVPCTSPIPDKFNIRFASFVWDKMEDEVDKVYKVDKIDKADKVEKIEEIDNVDSESRHSITDRPVLVSQPFPLQNPFRALQVDNGQRAHDDDDEDDDAISYTESEKARAGRIGRIEWADEVTDASAPFVSMWL